VVVVLRAELGHRDLVLVGGGSLDLAHSVPQCFAGIILEVSIEMER
jgi:hypothetical protein